FLYQQNTLRDALVAAINFNIFHKHTDRVRMTNIAQTVNVLQAMILTDKEKMVLTPTYHVFHMYKPFQDSTYIPTEFRNMPTYKHADYSVPMLTASAAKDKDGNLVLALVNLDPHNNATVMTRVEGGSAKSATGHLLTAPKMDSLNSFDAPNKVKPVSYKRADSQDGQLVLDIPAKSVLVVT